MPATPTRTDPADQTRPDRPDRLRPCQRHVCIHACIRPRYGHVRILHGVIGHNRTTSNRTTRNHISPPLTITHCPTHNHRQLRRFPAFTSLAFHVRSHRPHPQRSRLPRDQDGHIHLTYSPHIRQFLRTIGTWFGGISGSADQWIRGCSSPTCRCSGRRRSCGTCRRSDRRGRR